MPPSGARDLRVVCDETVARFAAAGVPDPVVDAELLIGHVLGLSRGGVQARLVMGAQLSEADAATLESLVVGRERREPLMRSGWRRQIRS